MERDFEKRMMRDAQKKFISTMGIDKIIQEQRKYPEEEGRKGRHFFEAHVTTGVPEWHPKWKNILLEWTLSGEWISVPRHREDGGGDPKNYRIARRERYVNEKGQIQEAMAYGTEKKYLLVWYDLDEVLAAFPKWVVPPTPKWENTGKWYNVIRKEYFYFKGKIPSDREEKETLQNRKDHF